MPLNTVCRYAMFILPFGREQPLNFFKFDYADNRYHEHANCSAQDPRFFCLHCSTKIQIFNFNCIYFLSSKSAETAKAKTSTAPAPMAVRVIISAMMIIVTTVVLRFMSIAVVGLLAHLVFNLHKTFIYL